MPRTVRIVRVRLYWVVLGIVYVVIAPILSILAASQLAQRQYSAYCSLVGSQVDVYSEATSDVGRQAHAVWLAEYRKRGCSPRK